jgi:hypothetical protein
MQFVEPKFFPPRWVLVCGSAAIVFHLFAALIAALDAPSGPWATPMGSSPALAPTFAFQTAEYVTLPYSRLVKMTSSFHFSSNKQEAQEVLFEALLKDANGKVLQTLRFPDPNANRWVRYRQSLLAQQLGNDEPVPPQQGVIVAPAGQPLPKQRWWQQDGEKRLKMIEDTPNAIPRNQPVMQPAPLSYIAAQSYARYLCKAQGADKVEIVRQWFDPVLPNILFEPAPPTDERLSRFYATYGDLPK